MSRRYTFLDLAIVNEPYVDDMNRAVAEVINSGRYIGGPVNKVFEEELAASCGAKYAIGTSNGLDALRLIFRAYIELGVMKAGDEVIVPANTYIASVLAISDNGLVPVFAEPDPDTLNLDTTRLDEYVSERTRAVLTVHLYGRSCFDSLLVDFADRYKLKIVEDNAQAIGATSHTAGIGGSHTTGALGHAAAFSFYPTKNIGALGDAGAVTTDDSNLVATIRAIANYGSDRQYHNIYRGLNCRLDPIQAAVLRVKLPHLEEINRLRHTIAAIYEHRISNPYIIKPLFTYDNTSVWHQYVIRVKDRDTFRQYLSENGVETMIHYPLAPFDQPCFRHEFQPDCPVARKLAADVVSLPVSRCTTEADACEIAAIINSYKPSAI